MKHDFKVTLFLLLIFICTQIFGLFLLGYNMDVGTSIDEETGEIVNEVNYDDIMTGRPETAGFGSFMYLFFAVFVGTAMILLLKRLKLKKVWKHWFFLAVALTLSIVFDVFFSWQLALGLGIIFTYLKIYRPNVIFHNLTEVLMYPGIALMIVPMFNLFWIIMVMIGISIYDFIAVFKTKHMVELAKFQSNSQVFAGVLIPYEPSKEKKNEKNKNAKISGSTAKIKMKIPESISSKETKSAILGGGDIAFTLIFSGVVMDHLVRIKMFTESAAFFTTLIVPVFATISLGFLFFFAKKDKFYPAMPFITVGCMIGLGIVMLI
ncbi:MAG: hypothetical protein KKF44_03960 [Nanoarchaeota archaeon]|nr:hypothetical protein [Nanoarchaeota archaeon]